MIIDVTGVELTPGEGGRYCLGNGEHIYEDGAPIDEKARRSERPPPGGGCQPIG